MTRTEAIRAAISRTTMHRQGHGWIVGTWSPAHEMTDYGPGCEEHYPQARAHYSGAVVQEACRLLGIEEEDVWHLDPGHGRIPDRVRAVVSRSTH